MTDTNGVAAPPETWARIYEVADREPEATHAEIAAAVGCGKATVWRALQARNAPALMELPIGRLTLDAGTQMRTKLDIDTINRYAAMHEEGVEFDPIEVVSDGTSYWVWDGFHRVHYRRLLNLATIGALVTRGTLRDAIRLACGANGKESLPRDDATRRRALATLLDDPEWGKLSVREIAATAQVSIGLVSRLLAERGESRELPPGLRKIAQIDAESGAPRSRERSRSPNGAVPSPLKAPPPVAEDAPERVPGADDDAGEPTPDEIDGKVDACPLASSLAGDALATFRADVRLYYTLKPSLDALGAMFKRHKPSVADGMPVGEFVYRVGAFLRGESPSRWRACLGCRGKGCERCHRRGYFAS
jgi:hypothetical protein